MNDKKTEPSLDEITAELACLHRQVVTRQPCRHFPRHEDLQIAAARILGVTMGIAPHRRDAQALPAPPSQGPPEVSRRDERRNRRI